MSRTTPVASESHVRNDWSAKLEALRECGGTAQTQGLPDEVLMAFAKRDGSLPRAIHEAYDAYLTLKEEFPDLIEADESAQVTALQQGIINFYPVDAVTPYVTLAARGPWLVTSKGAVLHDSGGYGMLGLGHAPDVVLDLISRPLPMANVITPHFSQARVMRALRDEIGAQRSEPGCPFTGFIFMNSGSEAVSVASRISDINAKTQTDPDGRYAGKPIRRLALKGGFHGRTQRPGLFSDSTRPAYLQHLASFRDAAPLLIVTPNDIEELRQVFADAEGRGEFIESLYIEPVMGEGNPGMAITRAFYDVARELTRAHGSLLLVDSIQAGLRAQGCLSIIDYPGFDGCEAPDMETYSKALNAGQYPLSVLAMTKETANLYRKGVYGNTMTAAPRALLIAAAVLDSITPELRANIRDMGKLFRERLQALADELGGAITKVQGTGLLVSCELDPKVYRSYGADSTEVYLRKHGIGVIHGGSNALRYTPHFAITSEEIDLIVDATRDALRNGPKLTAR